MICFVRLSMTYYLIWSTFKYLGWALFKSSSSKISWMVSYSLYTKDISNFLSCAHSLRKRFTSNNRLLSNWGSFESLKLKSYSSSKLPTQKFNVFAMSHFLKLGRSSQFTLNFLPYSLKDTIWGSIASFRISRMLSRPSPITWFSLKRFRMLPFKFCNMQSFIYFMNRSIS